MKTESPWPKMFLRMLALAAALAGLATAHAQSPLMTVDCTSSLGDYDPVRPGPEWCLTYTVNNVSDGYNMINFTLPVGRAHGVIEFMEGDPAIALGESMMGWSYSVGETNTAFTPGSPLRPGDTGRITLYAAATATVLGQGYASAQANTAYGPKEFNPVLVSVPVVGGGDGLAARLTVASPAGAGLGSNGFVCRLTGAPGYWYALEASTNLQQWAALSTNQYLGTPLEVRDAAAAPWRFYRARCTSPAPAPDGPVMQVDCTTSQGDYDPTQPGEEIAITYAVANNSSGYNMINFSLPFGLWQGVFETEDYTVATGSGFRNWSYTIGETNILFAPNGNPLIAGTSGRITVYVRAHSLSHGYATAQAWSDVGPVNFNPVLVPTPGLVGAGSTSGASPSAR